MDWKEHMETLFWKKLQKGSGISKHEWKTMSAHPFLKKEMVVSLSKGCWDWRILSRQVQPWKQDLILLFPWKPWDWIYLTYDLPLSFIYQNPTLPWDYPHLWRRFSSPGISLSITTRSEDWSQFSSTCAISFILKYLHFPWNWKQVSRNPTLTLSNVLQWPSFSWDFTYILKHVYFSVDDLKRPNRYSPRLDFKLLSQNPYCRPQMVKRFLEKNWDWCKLAVHPAFPPQTIFFDPILSSHWRWGQCLKNPRLDFVFYHFLRKRIRIPNHFNHLSENHFEKSLTLLPYQLSILTRFLWICFLKKRILYKLQLLLYLKKRMNPFLLRQVLYVYV